MNELKDKSDINLMATQLLYDNALYDSVCHPAYYACLQLMSHKLIRKGIDLNQQASIASAQYNGNSHIALIKEIEPYLKTGDYQRKRAYMSYVRKLKEMREKADYKNQKISCDESGSCISMAKFVTQILNAI